MLCHHSRVPSWTPAGPSPVVICLFSVIKALAPLNPAKAAKGISTKKPAQALKYPPKHFQKYVRDIGKEIAPFLVKNL